ncbi:hypothetical protein [Pseudonocardia thermophila]|uniref:hypothetical protein n=1 Tax=Pseudonocardia thermophila TaxID=1848 RepID=UPI0011613B43|nr:hypothetical protein [Pseudonocardia thermophila]
MTMAVVGAVVSGCAGPGGPGTGAVIGDHVISLNDVEQQIDAALTDPDQTAAASVFGWGTDGLSRLVVESAVSNTVVGGAATAAGVRVPPEELEGIAENVALGMLQQQLQMGNMAVRDPSVVDGILEITRRAAPWQAAAIELGRHAIGRVSVVVDEVTVRDRETAERFARLLASGGNLAEQVLAEPGARRGAAYAAGTDTERAGTILFGVPEGTVVAYQPNPANASWSVARVVQRRTDGPGDPAAAEQLSQSELLNIGIRVAQAEQGNNPVVVNPRFGVWDPVGFRLVAPEDQAGLVILPS